MWHHTFISSELYVQSSAALPVSYFLCNSVLEMDNYTFLEYADMHVILCEARDSAAVEGCVRRALHKVNPRAFHAIDGRSGRPVLFALVR
jgi:hypothetical protein